MPAESYFYIDQTNETVGPISWEVLLQLERAGAVSPDTHAAPEGDSDWVPFSELKAKEETRAKLPPVPVATAEFHTGSKSDRDGQKTQSEVVPSHGNTEARPDEIVATVRVKPIKWDSALWLTGLVTSIGITVDLCSSVGRSAESEVLSVFALLVGIPAIIFGSILHYQCWHALPIKYRVTSPERAIGFLFIPFFNLYWAFVSWVNLAEGYEAWQRESDLTSRHTMKALGVTQAVLFCLPFILLPMILLLGEFPIISIMLGIASLVVFGLFYFKAVTTANQLISGEFKAVTKANRLISWKLEVDEDGEKAKSAWWLFVYILLGLGMYLVVKEFVQKSIPTHFIVAPLILVSIFVTNLKRK